MIDSIIQFGIFLLEAITIVAAILIVFAGIFAMASKAKEKDKGKLLIKKLNKYYEDLEETINQEILEKDQLKQFLKEKKTREKEAKKEKKVKQRLFVLDFDGDIKASAVESLREEITSILKIAKPQDEVMLRLESGGGVVHGYGLAASQLKRLKDQNIKLTIGIDKVAASGGYMMACVADQILAAPFAIVGSIGVIAQLPNFNRLLKKHHVDFEQIKAGQFKRTLSLFGENTRDGREKFQEEVNETHELFKKFVKDNRKEVDIQKIATGEHWYGEEALKLKLVDTLITTDDYLLKNSKNKALFEIKYIIKKKWSERAGLGIQKAIAQIISIWH